MRGAALAFVVWLLLGFGPDEAQAQARATVRPGEVLSLSGPKGSIEVGTTNAAVSIPPALARQLGTAHDYFFVGGAALESGGAWHLLLVVQMPSKPQRGTGHCGAGTEDSLHLLAFDHDARRLVQRDQLLLQSCLQSLSLADDTGASLRERMEPLAQPGCLRLQWLDHPTYGDAVVGLQVHRGRLRNTCGPGRQGQ